jgi:type II secretory pathway predicted ATPase ExeA/outer membrane protein OmpA-like peptidoglycan-associated protein
MYLDYYDLKEHPFSISPDPKFIWFSQKHAEAYSKLKYGITEDKGLLILTGEVGTGKTLLIKYLEKNIPIPAIMVTVPDPDMKILEFYNYLAEEIKMKAKIKNRGDFLIHFKNFLYNAYGEQNKVLLILDEAQRINYKLLEQIRLLSNFEISKQKLLNIFLVGQNEFTEMLKDDRCKAVNQRIIFKYHLDPFSAEETSLYIAHRLQVAGTEKPIFRPDAIDEIYAFSAGYPRSINILCDNSLFYGWRSGLRFLDADAIKGRAEELNLEKQTLQEKKDEPLSKRSISEIEKSIGHKPGIEKIVDHKIQTEEKAFDQQTGEDKNEKDSLLLSKDQTVSELKTEGTKAIILGDHTKNKTYRSPLKIFGYVAIVVFVISLGYTTFYLFNSGIKSNLQYTIEDIAPKQKFGATENESNSVENKQDIKNETSKNYFSEQKTKGQIEKNEPESKTGEFLTKSTAEAGQKKTDKKIQQEDFTSLSDSGGSGVKGVPTELSSIKKYERYRTPDALNQQILEKGRILIQFANDSYEISESSLEMLDIILNFIFLDPNTEIIVEGFTDSLGNYWYNKKLSQSRADAVKNYFVEQGLSPSRIKSKGRGSDSPIGDNQSFEGRRRNRRVEIRFAFSGASDSNMSN